MSRSASDTTKPGPFGQRLAQRNNYPCANYGSLNPGSDAPFAPS